MPLRKCIMRCLLEKRYIIQQSERNCESTVAAAAPVMPHPKTSMKRASSMALLKTVKRVAYIASFGIPDARIMALSPKYSWVMILPKSITNI